MAHEFSRTELLIGAEGLENLFSMANINIFNYEEVAAPTEVE